jgi:tRNA threonylcarbamoyladenosine biosynthesis protein TsaE
MEVTAATAADMHRLGVALAALLRPGDLILADGPLGAGKTALAQGIGAGLGVVGSEVRSPTYTIADRHEGGRLPFVHIDAWRLGSAAELTDLDLDLDDAATYVEWGVERAEGLAEAHLLVTITRAEDDDARTVTLTAVSDDWVERLGNLALQPKA